MLALFAASSLALLAPYAAWAGTTTCSRYPCSATIGSRGGTITIPSYFSLTIPAGALRSNTTFTVTLMSSPAVMNAGTPLSTVIRVTPSTATFTANAYIERADFSRSGIPDLWRSPTIIDPVGWMPSPELIYGILDPLGWTPTPDQERTILDPLGWLPVPEAYDDGSWVSGEVEAFDEMYFVVATPR
jgi:hypothetical protein